MQDQTSSDRNLFLKDDDNTQLENYIPVSRFALMAALAKHEQAHGQGQKVTSFFPMLEIWRHQEYRSRILSLKESYLQFSPDRDTVSYLKHTEQELDDKLDTMVELTTTMLEQANYCKIANEDLNRILSEASAYGLSLSVDLDDFEEVMIYYRGADSKTRQFRSAKTLWLKLYSEDNKFYRRLFLLFKMKPEAERVPELMRLNGWSEKKARRILKKSRARMPKNDDGAFVYMKLFKNIPEGDLEMMFPNTQVRFKMFDKIKLGVTAGGGTLASLAGAAGKLVLATTNPVAFMGALVGVAAVIFRNVKSFFMTRDKYQLQLAERLYFHALADNRGALTLLADRGEEEDIKEDMLLYYFLYYYPVSQENLGQLDKQIEDYLFSEFGVRCDFDIPDALKRLAEDGLIFQEESGLLAVVPPSQASQVMDEKWEQQMDAMKAVVLENNETA